MAVGSLVSAISTAVCVFLEYWSWGVSTGLFFNPDWESILVILVVAAAATFIYLLDCHIFRQMLRKNSETISKPHPSIDNLANQIMKSRDTLRFGTPSYKPLCLLSVFLLFQVFF